MQTVTAGGLTLTGQRTGPPDVAGLAVTWCAEAPGLVGAVMLTQPGSASTLLFGRGDPQPADPFQRVRLFRQRPGTLEPAGPVMLPQISREQLHLEPKGSGLSVRRVGRLRMLYGGEEVDRIDLLPGDLIELRNVLQLVCVRRPPLLPAPPGLEPGFHPFGEPDAFGLVGESPAIWELRQRTAFIAGREGHVLVLGESGTGKELVARAIHQGSARARRPMVARNAATFPETLIDAELFGNARSYPNPGMPERPGLIGEADGSTLFLDELGELPSSLQAHLLRVLDSGEYQRLGESAQRRSDFRLIAATNRAPEELKHDILARLGWRLTVPDLNVRREDVPLLVRHLLRRLLTKDPGIARFFRGGAAPEPNLSPALMRALVRQRYSTHIRELQALLFQAMSHSLGPHLDLCPEMALEEAPLEEPAEAEAVDPDAIPPEVLQASLDRHDGVQAKVWQELGLKSRFVLSRLIRKHGLVVRPGQSEER